MTSWPAISDYKAALQHPARCFRDDWLATSETTLDRNRLPFGIAGGFGVVFPMRQAGVIRALKCFTEGNADLLRRRYQAIQAHLDGAGWPEYMTHFRFIDDAMMVRGQACPVLLMNWVDGPRLNAWLCDRIAQADADAIRAMADRWCALCLDLAERGIAHGDLQHGNVLVLGDQLVLVDYDGMLAFSANTIGEELLLKGEAGYPGYQHRQRTAQLPSASSDHFSAWVILLALRAAAADLSFFDADPERLDDTLLFFESDLDTPEDSWVWRQLEASPDADVRAWTDTLRGSLDRPFEEIPVFAPCSAGDLQWALQQREYLAMLQQMPTADSESSDRAFSAGWDDAVLYLADVPAAALLAERYRDCAERLETLDQIALWLADPTAASEDLPSLLQKLPTDYCFERRLEVEAFADDAVRIRQTLTLLQQGHEAFRSPGVALDFACIRQYAAIFARHRSAIEQAAQVQMHQVELSSTCTEAGGLHVTWRWDRWAKLRYLCWYAVTADRWLETPDAGDPYRGEGAQAIELDTYQRHCRRAGGVPIRLPTGTNEAFLTIWPVLELGFTLAIGNPLHVGPVSSKPTRKLRAAPGLWQ